MKFSESEILECLRDLLMPILAPGAHELLDDGAELPPCASGYTRVVSLDAFQEHNDFELGLGPLESAGYRAVVQNLSDLAAMGAKPVGFVWSLELPESWLLDNLKNFCTGVIQASQRYDLKFYGGDLSKSPDRFSCSITIFGDVLGKPPGRRGAKPGDKIYVSRPLGGSAAEREGFSSTRDFFWPKPELELGHKLVGHATACMDISDGLAKDLYRLCKASKVGFKLTQIPCSEGATREQALYGGEDYALLFTASHSSFGIEIGEITSGPLEILEPKGFDHFTRS